MGQIIFTATTASGTLTKAYDLPDAHVNRIIAFGRNAFAQPGETAPLPIPLGFARWCRMLLNFTRDHVMRYERDTTAIESIDPTEAP